VQDDKEEDKAMNKEMRLEEQVVSLELSKELKEAGYEQEGIFYWVKINDITDDNKEKWIVSLNIWSSPTIPHEHIVAPTVAELGRILPEKHIMFVMNKNKYWVEYQSIVPCKSIVANTEANARAKMWLYLKKEGLL